MTVKPLAIFDIDGTIFRSSLSIELCFSLVEAGIFSREVKKAINKDYQGWLNRESTYDKFVLKVVDEYAKYIKGKNRQAVVEVSRQVIEKHKNRVYRYTRKLRKVLKNHYFLLAISGSPVEILEQYKSHLSFDYVIGTIFEVDKKGNYTGAVVYEPAKKKYQTVQNFLKSHDNLSLENSLGIGDTESDIGFLELVEYPIAFNPNLNLKSYIEKYEKEWMIVVERKDVLYYLNVPHSGYEKFIFKEDEL